jgi:hypothetical protein
MKWIKLKIALDTHIVMTEQMLSKMDSFQGEMKTNQEKMDAWV